MTIAADLIRGHTDTIILAQLLKKDSYGYEINKTIRLLSSQQFELKEATLYTAFRRLEEMGFICSYWGGEMTGARRRYYSITEKGRMEYYKQRAMWKMTKNILEKLIELEETNHA